MSNKGKCWLEEIDFQTSATALMIDEYLRAFDKLNGDKVSRMLDLGCGFGGVTKAIGEYVGASALFGVDNDYKKLDIAKQRGLIATASDLEQDKLPFPSGYFDLVTCNGVLEHLRFYDNPIVESYRVLKDKGYFVVTLPNLGSYVSRLSLLFGYQPSDVTVSSQIRVGTSFMRGKHGINHIHAATIGAMRELLTYYRFNVLAITKGDPRLYQPPFDKWWWLFKIVGSVCSVGWSRRMIIVAQKGVN